MFVDSSKSVAEIEAAIKEQQQENAKSRKGRKRVAEPTRMVVEGEPDAPESEMVKASPDTDGDDFQAPTDNQDNQGPTLNGISLSDLINKSSL